MKPSSKSGVIAMRNRSRCCGLATLAAAALASFVSPAWSAEFMFRATVDGHSFEGKPLSWDAANMRLLGRDGQLHEFDPRQATDATKTGPRFVGYSSTDMRDPLLQEFGPAFEVTMTRHYVVVHPQGQRDEWANRFEDLYNRFGHYFR